MIVKTTSVVRSITAIVVSLLSTGQVQGAQGAPAAASLPISGVQSNGTYTVTISNPKVTGGSIETLALQVSVQGETPVRQVSFSVMKDGNDVYSYSDNSSPYCLTGDNNNGCVAHQAGDRWGTGQPHISVGNYEVQVQVYRDPTQDADWTGTVRFKLISSHPVADEPAYGTGTGNGPLAEIEDAFYTTKGMRKFKVQAKVFTSKGRPMKPSDVDYVWFRVQRTSDFADVYSNIELSPPYCIFAEAADGKTCKTLRTGDMWPQSNRFVEDSNGNRTGKKENDPDIQRTKIAPGQYQLSISIRTHQGSWDSNGSFVVLP